MKLVVVVLYVILTVAHGADTLRSVGSKANIYLGAVRNFAASLSDTTYNTVVDSEYNIITAENECKWSEIRPSKDTFNFNKCDYILNKSTQAGAKFRGHNLCWGENNPSWLTSGRYSKDELTALLERHITRVMSYYKGRILAWDVVNEAVKDSPSPGELFKTNVWYPSIPNYVDIAFNAARIADPSAKLFYNDYSADGLNAKSDAVFQLVKGMKSRGVPIDGVGLQMHISTNNAPPEANISANIRRLGTLGLEVHITEIDVACENPCDENLQANIYAQVLRACLKNSNCKSFQSWGFTDKYTWLGTQKKPLPFDENFRKKPTYQKILATLLIRTKTTDENEFDTAVAETGSKSKQGTGSKKEGPIVLSLSPLVIALISVGSLLVIVFVVVVIVNFRSPSSETV